jgi:hypothetical protein
MIAIIVPLHQRPGASHSDLFIESLTASVICVAESSVSYIRSTVLTKSLRPKALGNFYLKNSICVFNNIKGQDMLRESARVSYPIQKVIEAYLEDLADLQVSVDRLCDTTDSIVTLEDVRTELGL